MIYKHPRETAINAIIYMATTPGAVISSKEKMGWMVVWVIAYATVYPIPTA